MQKTILITGAGAGIGAATARHFAAQGWRVGLYDRDEVAVRALAAALGANAQAGLLDVTQPAHWQRVMQDWQQQVGRLDVLFNNAGILYSGPFEEISAEQHARTFEVNVMGVIHGCLHALPLLRATPGSRVINMSSASAIYGQINLSSYSASKFAVRALTEALDGEWAAHGIKVMDIMPLFVQTGMLSGMKNKSVERLGVRITPEDVARTVWQAAQDDHALSPLHWVVGWQTRLFYQLTRITPAPLNRRINRLIGR